jgi:glyoxylase-like metal-dependent hydrolase (beta-lactamase superfamily II)
MEIRLELLVAGSCRHLERVVRRGGAWRSIRFPSMVGVLHHPTRGVVLFDTGYSPRFFAETARFPYSLYRRMTPVECSAEDTAAAQLVRRGLDPRDVSLVVLSHFHADHLGGLHDFPRARFLYFRAAFDRAWRSRSALGHVRRAFLPGHLPADFEDRSDWVEDSPRLAVPGLSRDFATGFDLLGDGSLLGLDVSGHVRGQLGVFAERTQGPPAFLVADACWTHRAFTHGELPHPITRLVTEDPRAYRERIGALARLVQARPEILVVPSHCEPSVARARALLGSP